ncbi:hypothetical protein GCM10011390_13890 [Aureimonas endophytica]|uniref:Uncharacterized protein n=2 Tax=Aureimonas endophytica TaxID=2027858 RepID=A0A917E375_9HYPH|nr:hypothetical protein GCM10011390_13890 [Aureimonas endophytica]
MGRIIAFPGGRSLPAPVDAEAARRVAALGYERWAARARLTGAPIPPEIRHLKMQIDFAATMLKQLSPLPEDFRSDGFWPA